MRFFYKCIFVLIQRLLLLLVERIVPFLQNIAVYTGTKCGEIEYATESLEFCAEDGLPVDVSE